MRTNKPREDLLIVVNDICNSQYSWCKITIQHSSNRVSGLIVGVVYKLGWKSDQSSFTIFET